MANTPPPLTLIDHPLVQHKLSLMRRRETSTTDFRQLLRETATLMAYEITRTLPLEPHDIVTPVAPTTAPMLAGEDLCLVSIMRAGDGLLQGMLDLIPEARVGHVGLYRDPVTLAAVEYYFKMPSDLDKRLDIFRLGQNGHCGCRGMNTSLGFRLGHALNPMPTTFVLQFAILSFASKAECNLLKTT